MIFAHFDDFTNLQESPAGFGSTVFEAIGQLSLESNKTIELEAFSGVPRFSTGISPAEEERLSILAEECAETIQIIMKIKRHGYGNDWSRFPNRRFLAEEIGHVQNAVAMLIDSEDIHSETVNLSQYSKSQSIKEYLHHQ